MSDYNLLVEKLLGTCNEINVLTKNYLIKRNANGKCNIDDKNKHITERIKAAEGSFDRLSEVIQKKEELHEKYDILFTLFKALERRYNTEIFNDQTEEEFDKMINLNIKLLEEKFEIDKAPFDKQINDLEKKKNSDIKAYQIIKKQKNSTKLLGLSLKKIDALEKMTGKKVENVIFDSEKDEWSKTNSGFKTEIKDEHNLLFLVEDDELNTFGGVVYNEIEKTGENRDNNAFVFSLIRNDELNPKKFEFVKTKEERYSFYLGNDRENNLFSFGDKDIEVCKTKSSGTNHCQPERFSYKLKDLTNDIVFYSRRIRVYQLGENIQKAPSNFFLNLFAK
ncbi:hypothetical protein EIN_340560 [Entamoeba invadens IP1]|uniref:TLDc domain-containing protein n=1 Tax=Entamoeba invadens IP1 TaxID=370355 RepID=A0A0A1UGA9_ENTIV|nr:hypothetical protein EIN_340560 [Entamoeba invadens IP1]ELP94718.1 hypothetical protein EIN_340560 [Entamoeba invadens IP1]|eukprot:XP_004261489.1 hypothetical protein EIN_340560 [Entamoeba invadens IP1]